MTLSKLLNIALFTSSRADFYPAHPLIVKLANHSRLNFHLLVGGGHLVTEQGYTLNDIIKLGFNPFRLFPFINENDPYESISVTTSRLYSQMADYFKTIHPDVLFLLGDRFELLPVAASAFLERVPIAHISGGDVTQGAIDNQVRNATSMLAKWHFPGTPESASRLMEMGIEKPMICICGEPGIEEILNTKLLNKDELDKRLGLSSHLKIVACTFHPETIENKITPIFIKNAIEAILEQYDIQLVVTASNFDPGGEQINITLKAMSEVNCRVKFFENLGSELYYSLLNHSCLLIGNSSSAIFESQSFNVPAVNIGDRQKGRTLNANTISCKASVDSFIDACNIALSDNFRNSFFGKKNYYGNGNTSSLIMEFMEEKMLKDFQHQTTQ